MTLRNLYQRRLKLTRELAALNAAIQILEKTSAYRAPLKVHHANGCGVGRRAPIVRAFGDTDNGRLDDNKKRTRDWSLVDCIPCHKTRKSLPSGPAPSGIVRGWY